MTTLREEPRSLEGVAGNEGAVFNSDVDVQRSARRTSMDLHGDTADDRVLDPGRGQDPCELCERRLLGLVHFSPKQVPTSVQLEPDLERARHE